MSPAQAMFKATKSVQPEDSTVGLVLRRILVSHRAAQGHTSTPQPEPVCASLGEERLRLRLVP
eukprot:11419052-Prorocentrum_lima.AAC.1